MGEMPPEPNPEEQNSTSLPLRLSTKFANVGVYQPSQFSSGYPMGLASPMNPDWDFTAATHGGLPGLVQIGIDKTMEKVVEPSAAFALNHSPVGVFMRHVDPGYAFKPGQSVIPDQLLPLAKEKGAIPALTRALQSFTTPGSIALLPIAPESKLVKGAFATQAALAMPEQVVNVMNASTSADRRDAVTELGLNASMLGLAGKLNDKSPIKGPVEVPLPKPAEAVAPQPIVGHMPASSGSHRFGVTFEAFKDMANRGKVGYNPRGDVVSNEQLKSIQDKYTIGNDDLSCGRDPRYHWELGTAFGYTPNDICAFLAGKWPESLERDRPIDEESMKSGYGKAVKFGLFAEPADVISKGAVEFYQSTQPKPLSMKIGEESENSRILKENLLKKNNIGMQGVE